MTRRKLIAILLFLLLLLIILCTWCHSSDILKQRTAQETTQFTTPITEAKVSSIDYALIKEKDSLELTGNFSSASNVNKIHVALNTNELKDNSNIDTNLQSNPSAIELTEKLIPIFHNKYSDGSIVFKDNKLTIQGIVPSQMDKNNIDALLASSTLLSVNNTTVVLPPKEPISFQIEKRGEQFLFQGIFNSSTNADKLLETLNDAELIEDIDIDIDENLAKSDEIILLTETLIEPFSTLYRDGYIQYSDEVLTVTGKVETQEAKDKMENVLKASGLTYENNTMVLTLERDDEAVLAQVQREAEEEAKAEALLAQEKAEAEAQAQREAEEQAKAKALLAQEKAEAEAQAQREAEEKAKAEALLAQEQAKAEAREEALLIENKIKLIIDQENINFNVNKSSLTEQSLVSIKKIAKILTEYPAVHVEIGGHTDNTGKENYNLSLSQSRVNRVMDKLIEMHIDASRLTAVGYGQTQPRVSNDTKENRRINRRVEFKVIGE